MSATSTKKRSYYPSSVVLRDVEVDDNSRLQDNHRSRVPDSIVDPWNKACCMGDRCCACRITNNVLHLLPQRPPQMSALLPTAIESDKREGLYFYDENTYHMQVSITERIIARQTKHF